MSPTITPVVPAGLTSADAAERLAQKDFTSADADFVDHAVAAEEEGARLLLLRLLGARPRGRGRGPAARRSACARSGGSRRRVGHGKC